MPKLQDFRIDFDRPNATYQPGETVTGKVVLKLSGSKNVREIRLEARGEAEVHWTKSRNVKDSSGRSHHHTDHYKGSEHYFSVSNRLVGGAEGQTTLPPGQHSYNFSFLLPLNTPCSIEHQYGYVRYTVKAVLDRPWRFDHKVVSAFTVVAHYDLNSQPRLIEGIDDHIKRKFCCCCLLNVGGVNITVHSRVSGFVPGETIELILTYDNNSRRVDLTKFTLRLQKELIFYATTPFSEKKEATETIRKEKIRGPFGKKGETSIKIVVPSLPPSRLEHCSIIHVSYNLILTASVSGMHFNITRVYPIEIGTIPIVYRAANIQTPMNPYVPTAPPIEQISPGTPQGLPTTQPYGFVVMNAPPYPIGALGAPPSYPEMPPPSYEECVSGSNTIVDQNEQGMHTQGSIPNVQFTPKYPVYKFPMSTPYPP